MTETMRFRSLSRGQRRKLEKDAAELAEELAAEQYGVIHRSDREEWYDAVDTDTGAKYEVKSATREIGDEYPARGRFRVRRDQTRSLLSSDARGTAWYVFVLIDDPEGVIRFRRMRPSTVSSIVRERGGWNQAGHEEFEEQMKLPISAVIYR